MVLFRRAPINLPAPPLLPRNLNVQVWLISETGEWFTNYDDYLERLDFYKERLFTCEITGQSQLTFFEAMNSEEVEFDNLETKFPLKIREPIAKVLHFNPTSRLDQLVKEIYDQFKCNFFPGETVYLKTAFSLADRQSPWIIKEKALFPAMINTETQEVTREAFCKYQIQNIESNESRIIDENKICRERNSFTKHLLKSFCKISLYKPSKRNGCPWCIKPEYLNHYNLDMTWPEEYEHYREIEVQPTSNAEEEPLNGFDSDSSLEIINPNSLKNGNVIEKTKQSGKSKKHKLEENLDSKSSGQNKKKKNNKQKSANDDDETINVSPVVEEVKPVIPPVPKITTITEDFEIPFDPNTSSFNNSPFKNFQKFDNSLNLVSFTSSNSSNFKELTKLFTIYQFINTFNKNLKVPLISLDNLITTLKCSQPQELAGETVYLKLLLPNKTTDVELISNNKRVCEYDQMIAEKYNIENSLKVVIKQADPEETITDSLIDDIQYNGTNMLVELFCSLIRLFIDETGNWSCIVQEDWIETETTKGKTEIPEDVENFISKVVDYKKTNWTDRVRKRQFQNGNWIICLIGIFQDAIHLPKYRDMLINIVSKIMIHESDNRNSLTWNKQLWRNFVWNLSIEEKIQSLWILMDLVLVYQTDIKSNIEISMEVVNNLKSERFKLIKSYKLTLRKISELEGKIMLCNKKHGVLEQTEDSANKAPELKALEEEKLLLTTELADMEKSRIQLELERDYWEEQLRINSKQHLKSLGKDRFGNTYWSLEANGLDLQDKQSLDFEQSNKLFIQGPNALDIEFHYNLSKEDYLSKLKDYKVDDKDGVTILNIEANKILLDSEGKVPTEYKDISNLEKKIVSEGLNNLLLDDNHWAIISNSIGFHELQNWLHKYGAREGQLKRVLENTKYVTDMFDVSTAAAAEDGSQDTNDAQTETQAKPNLPLMDEDEARLLKELDENDFTAEEKLIIQNYVSSYDLISAEDKESLGQEAEFTSIGKELDYIVQKIMALEDSSSKTRKVLDEIAQLEEQKLKLVQKRLLLVVNEKISAKNTDVNPNKNVVNTKLIRSTILPKLETLQDLLSELHNHKYSQRMESCSNWENNVALDEYGKYLWKGGNNNGKEEPVLPTAEERMAVIQANIPNSALL